MHLVLKLAKVIILINQLKLTEEESKTLTSVLTAIAHQKVDLLSPYCRELIDSDLLPAMKVLTDGIVEGNSVRHCEVPDNDDRATVIYFEKVVHGKSHYEMDKHNVATFMKFHSFPTIMADDAKEFPEKGYQLNITYAHVDGVATLMVYRNMEGYILLDGEFTLDDFVPVKMVPLK